MGNSPGDMLPESTFGDPELEAMWLAVSSSNVQGHASPNQVALEKFSSYIKTMANDNIQNKSCLT